MFQRGHKINLGKRNRFGKLHPHSEETKVKIGNSNKGKKRSFEMKKRMSEARKNSYDKKGRISPINMTIRDSLEYKLWRESVFTRDNYTCIWCGIKSGSGKTVVLNADHIKPFALFPELRFAIDNGRTLCVDCHKKTDTYLSKSRWIKN